MITRHHVHGYEAFCKFVSDLPQQSNERGDPPLYFYFVGSDENDENWSPWCTDANPVVEEGLKLAPEDSVFVRVTVGSRGYWRLSFNHFRTDERLKLEWMPTLIRWNTEQRLDYGRLSEPELVNAFFAHK